MSGGFLPLAGQVQPGTVQARLQALEADKDYFHQWRRRLDASRRLENAEKRMENAEKRIAMGVVAMVVVVILQFFLFFSK